ncbi:MAG: hypothetical protein WCK11_01995 [Candidatus Falkowbacteria bacterium]
MNFKEYILRDLNSLKLRAENKNIDTDRVADLIYKLLMSKKFRKYSVEPSYQQHILKVIKDSVANNEPIKLTLVFGGYKLWRLEEAPQVDWAELFSLIYYAKWLKPIAEIYKPGVWFDFYSDDVILERMNNIPISDTETYIQSFKQLLGFFENYLPENLKLTLSRVGDQYSSRDEFNQELDQLIQKLEKEVCSVPLTSKQITAVDLNVKLSPGQDDNADWREKVNLMHEAYSKVSKRRPYYRNDQKIFIITRPIKDALAVGTTKRSVVKFWIGAGVAHKEDDDYSAYIYSPKQLEANNFARENVEIDGLAGQNFKSVRIMSI